MQTFNSRADALEQIQANPEQYFTRAKAKVQGKATYVCPLCGNGSGNSGTGISEDSKNPRHYKCFKCGAYGDIVDYIAMANNLTPGSADAFKKAYEIYGLTVEPGGDYPLQAIADTKKSTKTVREVAEPDSQEQKDQAVIKAYLNAHFVKGGAIPYLQGRGISEATADRLRFGYAAAGQAHYKEAAVVIPTSYKGKYAVIERRTENEKAKALNWSSPLIFNEAALDTDGVVFICEGAITAASIEEVGGHALAYNSTSNADKFISLIKARGYKCSGFIICADADEAGEKAAATLKAGIEALKTPVEVLKMPENKAAGYDANNWLQDDKEGFKTAIIEAQGNFKDNWSIALADIESHLAKNRLAIFQARAKEAVEPIPTGFAAFDAEIGGGLLPNLYFIGAITTLGKTTFALQIADHIAAAGHFVLVFSLEMPEESIIARSLSRITYTAPDFMPHGAKPKTELDFTLQAHRNSNFTDKDREQMQTAARYYANNGIGDYQLIYEGRKTVDEIRATVEQFTKIMPDSAPVVVVDYLQIIKPTKELQRGTQREQIDYAVDALCAMRRELKTPILCISSFNRNSYTGAAGTDSFKESGAIEYSGDAVITLEYSQVTQEDLKTESAAKKAVDREAAKDERQIKATFKKNRGNRVGASIEYKFAAAYNTFTEKGKQ